MKHLIPEFERWKARFPKGFESSLVLPCVRRIQEDRGYVADSDIDGLVEYLGVPRMQIEQVLSYYTQFRREADRPLARADLPQHHLLDAGRRAAHRPSGEEARRGARARPRADGRFTLSTVECLGSCGTAPVVMVNDTYHENMSAEKIDALLERAEIDMPGTQAADDVPGHGDLAHAGGLPRARRLRDAR